MGQNQSSGMSRSGSIRSLNSLKRNNKQYKAKISYISNLSPCDEFPELMNINTATEEQLMTLPGVTRQLAREIVRHRQIIGQFKIVDDIALVSGVGVEKLESIRSEICVESWKRLSQAETASQTSSVTLSSECKLLLSVNSSSIFELQGVPGLHQEIAANIVDYRSKKGPFKSLDELKRVRGMDSVTLNTAKQYLCLDLVKNSGDPYQCGYQARLNQPSIG